MASVGEINFYNRQMFEEGSCRNRPATYHELRDMAEHAQRVQEARGVGLFHAGHIHSKSGEKRFLGNGDPR